MQLRNRSINQNPDNVSSPGWEGDVTDSPAESDNSESFNKSHPRSLFKHVLSRKIFVGEYKERRYVKSLKCYRDIVIIDEGEEDLIKGLKKMQKIANENYPNKWLGITTEEINEARANYCLWVELEKLTLGKYWFKVHSVTIKDEEIILQLKQIRPYETKAKLQNCDLSSFDFNEVFNLTTAWELMKFSMVLLATIITCVVNALPYLAEYILKFMRELNNTLRVLTPLFIAGMEMISRCIGGLYWMIIMLFKSPGTVQRPYSNYPLALKGRKNYY